MPLIYGGTGSNSFSDLPPENMPERFEAGTLNAPGLAGLTAAIDFLQQTGLETIRAREEALMTRLIDGLQAIAGVELYGPLAAGLHGGALSFNLVGRDPGGNRFSARSGNSASSAAPVCTVRRMRTAPSVPFRRARFGSAPDFLRRLTKSIPC